MARSDHVVALDYGTYPIICIPLDRAGGTVEERAERAARWAWAHGLYPSPSVVNMRMRGKTRDCLNGIETRARNRVMEELKIPRQRKAKRPYGDISTPLDVVEISTHQDRAEGMARMLDTRTGDTWREQR